MNRASYGEPDIAELAALYALGIVQNHPFLDGNKRTGYVMLEAFLELNGAAFSADDAEAAIGMLKLAGGEFAEHEFID